MGLTLLVYSVYDEKAKAYLQPWFALNRETAERTFQAACWDDSHQFHRFAADFTLFEIGAFDQERGVLAAFDNHRNLGTALAFRGGLEISESTD